MIVLIPKRGRSFRFTGDMLRVGREASCDLVVNDKTVSRRHALIERRPEGWVVSDTASINGVRVDSQKVKEALLRSGQRLTFGSVSFVVEISPEIVEPNVFPGQIDLDEAATETDHDPSSATVSMTADEIAAVDPTLARARGPSPVGSPRMRRRAHLWAIAIGSAWIGCVASLGIAYLVLRGRPAHVPDSPRPVEASAHPSSANAVPEINPSPGPVVTPETPEQPPTTAVPTPDPTPRPVVEPTPTFKATPTANPTPLPSRLQARLFAGFDTRLKARLLAMRQPSTPADLVGIATGVLFLFPGQLVAQTNKGSWAVGLDFPATHAAQLEDGSVWLRRGDQMVPLEGTNPDRRPFPVAPGSLVRSHSAGDFVIGIPGPGSTRLEILSPSGSATPLATFPGSLHALSRTKAAVAAIIGSAVYLRSGNASFKNLDTATEYEDATDIVAVDAERTLVSLRAALWVVGPAHHTIVALLRARLASNGAQTYVYDVDSGSLWEVEGFGAIGPLAADQAHGRQLLASAASCRPERPCPAYDEAARLLGNQAAAALLGR